MSNGLFYNFLETIIFNNFFGSCGLDKFATVYQNYPYRIVACKARDERFTFALWSQVRLARRAFYVRFMVTSEVCATHRFFSLDDKDGPF